MAVAVALNVLVLLGPCGPMGIQCMRAYKMPNDVHEIVPSKPSSYVSILSDSDWIETNLTVCWAAFLVCQRPQMGPDGLYRTPWRCLWDPPRAPTGTKCSPKSPPARTTETQWVKMGNPMGF